MITQDYFALGGKAFPEGCIFSQEELTKLSDMNAYYVYVGHADKPQIWHATDLQELKKALGITYVPGTKLLVYRITSELMTSYEL